MIHRIAVLLFAALWIAGPTRGDVSVTHVANAGFLIRSGDAKVLVDALIDDGLSGYRKPTDATRAALEAASAPFDDVTFVLATHYHGDHFGPKATARHLLADRGAWFVSTPQAVAEVSPLIADLPERERRVHAVFPAEGEVERVSRDDVRVRALNLHHGRGGDPPVQNLGFIVEIGGLTILHVGDTEAVAEDLEPYGLAELGIDVALLPSWMLIYPAWVAGVREQIRPAEIVIMHVPAPDAPANYFGDPGSVAGLLEAARRNFPDLKALVEPGDRHTFRGAPAPAAERR